MRSYISRGFYSEQLRRVWRFFPVEQLLVVKQEDLLSRPEQCLHRIHRHLGVTALDLSEQKSVISWRSIPENGTAVPEASIPRKAGPEITAALRDLYCAEIQNLETMLGWDCSDWLQEGLI